VQLLTYLSEVAAPNQVRSTKEHNEVGIPLRDPRPFDLHILLVNLNNSSATLGHIEPTRLLAKLFRKRLCQQQRNLLGEVLCLQMDIATVVETDDPKIGCWWGA
jgi:hypothetical protein